MKEYEEVRFLYPWDWQHNACNLEEDVIERFKKCMAGIWSVEDMHDWPVRLNHISHLFASEFSQDLLQCLERLEEQGCTSAEIGKLFGHPSTIFRTFDLLLKGMYKLGFTTGEKRKKVIDILGCIQTLKAGSIFNEDGKNTILAPDSIAEICKKKLHPVEEEQYGRKIQLFIGLVKAYIEQLYFRGYDISQEVHGPYYMEHSSQLLIREFSHLEPRELWPELRLLSLDKIEIYTVYNSTLHICLDSYNHLYQDQDKGIFTKALSCVGLEIYPGYYEGVDLDSLIVKLSGFIQYNARLMKNMDWKEAAMKYVDIFYFKLSSLFERAGYLPQYKEKAKENIKKGNITVNSEQFFQEGKIQLLLNLLL